MKREPDLTPMHFGWRGAIAGFTGPCALFLFLLRYPTVRGTLELVVALLVVGGFGGILGAVSGLIIDLFYSNGFRVGLAFRVFVALSVPTFAVLPFLIALRAGIWETIFYALIMGLLPAIVTTPRWVSARPKQGEVI